MGTTGSKSVSKLMSVPIWLRVSDTCILVRMFLDRFIDTKTMSYLKLFIMSAKLYNLGFTPVWENRMRPLERSHLAQGQ